MGTKKLEHYNPKNVWQTNHLPCDIPDGMIWDKLSSKPEDISNILREAQEAQRLRPEGPMSRAGLRGDLVIINGSSLWQLCDNCHQDYFYYTGVNMNYCYR